MESRNNFYPNKCDHLEKYSYDLYVSILVGKIQQSAKNNISITHINFRDKDH